MTDVADNSDWSLTIDEVNGLLQDAPFIWCIAGGWALDLYLGRISRKHVDVDVLIFRRDLRQVLNFFHEYALYIVTAPGELTKYSEDYTIQDTQHTIWVRSKDDKTWLFELIIENSNDEKWLYRRNPSISMPLKQMIVRRKTYLLLAPEIVLLYKSKGQRLVDVIDIKTTLPHLNNDQRQWFEDTKTKLGYL